MVVTSYAERVTAHLHSLLQPQSAHPRLQEAMSYATLNGGKRLRPHLIYTTASLYQVPLAAVDDIAAAYEMVQAYSLVHDDLPDMDNSPLRRGQPSCWKAFEPATAILVGDALLTYAFEVIAGSSHLPEKVRLRLVQSLAIAIGANGMVAGQMYDLLQVRPMVLNAIEQLQMLKTGAFFAACCEAGAILGQVPGDQGVLKKYGYNLGLIFQITDDLLDVEGNIELTGKPTAQDHNKQTYIKHLGMSGARDYLNGLCKETKALIAQLSVAAPALEEVIDWIVARKS